MEERFDEDSTIDEEIRGILHGVTRMWIGKSGRFGCGLLWHQKQPGSDAETR